MNYNITIERIDFLCKQHGISKTAAYTKSNVGKDFGANIKKGYVPSSDKILALADFLDCSVDYLLGRTDNPQSARRSNQQDLTPDEEKLLTKYRALDDFGKKAIDKLLSIEYERCTTPNEDEQPTIKIRHSYYKVSAGTGFDLEEGDVWDDTIDVPDTPEARKADYALTIQGDSMEPVFRNNDIILVKQQDAVDFGQIGIFVLNKAGYIKKFGGDRLISLNDEYEDILIEEYDDYRCVGKVICRL